MPETTSPPIHSDYVRVHQAPEAFGVDRATIYRWAQEGHIVLRKRGRMTWVKRSEVNDYIEGGKIEQ